MARNTIFLVVAAAVGVLAMAPRSASAHEVNVDREKDQFFYFIDTPYTPRAWPEPGFELRLGLFNIPGRSSPNPEVGFTLAAPGISVVLFDRLELHLDTTMVVNPNARGGRISVDDPKEAATGRTDFGGADYDFTSMDFGVLFAILRSKESPIRLALGLDYGVGILNKPNRKHFDGGPFLSAYDHKLHGYLSAAFSFARYLGIRLHAGATMAVDLQRDVLFPDQDLRSTDIWIDYSLTASYTFAFAGTAVFAGVDGNHLAAGVTSGMVEDQLAAFGGFAFVVGTTDVSISLEVPFYSKEYRSFADFFVNLAWSSRFGAFAIGKGTKPKPKNELPDLVRTERVPDCAPAGASTLIVRNGTGYTLTIEYEPVSKEAPEEMGLGPAAGGAETRPAAAAPATRPAAPGAPASAPATMPAKTVTLGPGAEEKIVFAALPIDLEVTVDAGIDDVPGAEGVWKLTYCGLYEAEFGADSMKTEAKLLEKKKQ